MSDTRNQGFRERLRDIGKDAKKLLKHPVDNLRRRPASSATTPSRPSTPQAMGSQPANPNLNEPTPEPIANHAQSMVDTSSSPLIPSDSNLNAEGITLASPEHGSLSAAPSSASCKGSSAEDGPPLDTSNEPRESWLDKAKDGAEVAGSFIQLLLRKAPIAVDTNPVKIVFGIAQIAIELKQGFQNNMDATERRIGAVLQLMIMVNDAIQNWHGNSLTETRAVKAFEAAMSKELDKFFAIQKQSKIVQFLVQEDDKQRIADIFERVNEARENLILATGLRVHQVTVTIDQQLKKLLRKELKPSYIADHKYYLEGETAKAIRRVACTPGTRPTILSGVRTWANDPSEDCSVYWLFGPAGTGKSTIACTIARRFEFASDPNDNIVLGANFFCSRQFAHTRSVIYVVRTIVYQLTLVCKAFADAYHEHGDDSTINQGPIAQIQGLLITPWKASQAGRSANNDPTYLIDIDAVDELDGDGGSELIAALFHVQGQLQGLKFFITSREDQALAAHAERLGDDNVCRLQEVSPNEADEDLRTYLREQIGHVANKEEIERLVRDAAGLFIYAATMVEHLGVIGRPVAEQRELLDRLLNITPSTAQIRSRSATAMLDMLYLQILKEALEPDDPEQDLFRKRLQILHTFLCTVERTSTSVATHLLDDTYTIKANAAQFVQHPSVADVVFGRLHAVLYSQGGQVLLFHKSFPDFVFDQARSRIFYCDQGSHNLFLAEGCLRVMHQQLCFNIANIPDSSCFDQHNPSLEASIKQNISPTLRYASQGWSQHLVAASLEDGTHVVQKLHDFLQLRVLFWMEVMNLLGLRRRCEGMLRKAQKWAASSKKFADLAKSLGDTAAFALYFSASPAASSTPHIYLSALATFPQSTDVRATWRTHFEGIPAFANVIRGTGGSPLMSISAKSEVYAVAFSPDGSCFVAGSYDGTIQVWDLSTGEELKALKGHSEDVISVGFSPDGSRIVSSSCDQTVRVWDTSSWEELKVLRRHNLDVFSVSFSPDGMRIVSGSRDQTVRVWDTSSWEELKVLRGHNSYVFSVGFSPDGTHIVSGSRDRTVQVWDASSGEELKVFKGHSSCVNSVAFSPDGTHIISGSGDATLRLFDASSGEELKILKGHQDFVTSVSWSPDGTHIVSGSRDETVRVWDALSGKLLKTLASMSHTGWASCVRSVAFSQDGMHIVSGSGKIVQVWDAWRTEEMRTRKGHSGNVDSVAFSQDDARIVSGSDDQTVRVWDALSGEELINLDGHTGGVKSVAFSSDAARIISGSDDKTVRVWDASNGEEQRILEGHSDCVNSVAFSCDDMRIISGSDDKTVRVWDALSGEELMILESSNRIVLVAASRDGTHILSSSIHRTVEVWSALSGEKLNTFQNRGAGGAGTSAAFSHDGMRLVCGCSGDTVQMWDALRGQQEMVFEGYGGRVRCVAYSRNGLRVVSGSDDQTVRVWRVTTDTHPDRYIRERAGQDHTGWLLSPTTAPAYLMFVPLSEHLPIDSNILTIPGHSVSHVDFSKAKLGRDWPLCYTPVLKK